MYNIYQISGPEGKVYIGQTKQQEHKRFLQHLSEARLNKRNNRFYNAIRKYGEHNFRVYLLDTTELQEEANRLECLYIRLLVTMNKDFGYNSLCGGKKYFFHTEETRSKIRAALKTRFPNGRQDPRLGQIVSEKTRKQISDTLTGKYRREKHSVYLQEITPERVFKEYEKHGNFSRISKDLGISRRTARRRFLDYIDNNGSVPSI